MRPLLAIAWVAAALGAAVPAAQAWGPDGHRIVGEIAWRSLRPATRAAVRDLLPRGEYGTLAEASTWADTYARSHPGYEWLEPLHYVNVDPSATAVRVGRDCGCVVGAIEIYRDRLADRSLAHGSRVEALRLLAHFVGDVHQPLHVSHPDGRGGTRTEIHFDGDPMTLHALWDTGLIERKLRSLPPRRGVPRWRRFAQALDDSIAPADRTRWAASRDPDEWAEESLAVARQHAFAVRDGAVLGDAYYAQSIPAVSIRLQQAGVRLAALLEGALGPPLPAAPSPAGPGALGGEERSVR